METNKNNNIDLRKVVRVVWERWWWFVVGVACFVLLGIAYYLRKSPTWNTQASVILRQSDEFGGLSDKIGSGLALFGLGGNAAGEDEVVVFSSRDLMTQTIDALNLWEYSYVKDKLRWKGEFRNPALKIDYLELTEDAQIYPFSVKVYPSKRGYKVKTRLGYFISSTTRVKDLSEPIQTAIGTIRIHANRPLSTDTAYKVVHKRHELVVADYREKVNVALNKKESNIIKFSMRSPMPERDRILLHQLIEQYNLNSIVDKNMLAQNTAAFIEERLNIITAELSEAEKTVSTYKERNSIANIEAQAKLFLEASSEEQRALAEIETQLSLVDYVDEFLRDENKRNNLIPSNIGITDPSLGASLSEYNAILLQRMRIQRTATESNPVIEQMDAQLATMRHNITATIASVRESLRIRQRSLKEQDSKFNRQIKNAPEQEREYIRVVRDQQIKEKLYLFLYEKREENALMLAASTLPTKILDMPQRDVRSMEPDLKVLLFVCILLGLLFPAGILYIDSLFNDRINDVKEYEHRVHTPLLGQLAQNPHKTPIAIREGESSASSELFRLMHTNLRFLLPATVKAPVILVTSYIDGEGKSYVSGNTALSLALTGKKVALVGLDLRNPMIAKNFELTQKGHLTDYLAEPTVAVDDVIIPSGYRNLDLVPCGIVPPNPSELLQSKRIDELFAELRKRYDYILVDSAALKDVSDAYLLDRMADLTIFVSRYHFTPTEVYDYLDQVVEQKRIRNIACVLNGVKR